MTKQVFEITIDCERNKLVDIRAGGPQYLGYNFCMTTTKDEEKLYWWFFKLVQDNHQPVLNIKIKKAGAWAKRKMWSEKEIEECIKKGYK